MARPTLYPKQLVCQISDDLGDRVERDAGQRQDKSKSAAARRLLELGVLLADALDAAGADCARLTLDHVVAVLVASAELDAEVSERAAIALDDDRVE